MQTFTKVMLLAALAFTSITAQSQVRREITKDFPLEADGSFSIDTYKGSIEIKTWERAHVAIGVVIEAEGDYDDAAQHVADTKIVFNATPSSVHVETDYDDVRASESFLGLFGVSNLSLPSTHYRIMIPRTARVQVDDYKSKIRIENIAAPVSVDTYKGTLHASDIDGRFMLDTYKGEFAVKGLSGGLKLTTYKGEGSVEFTRFADHASIDTYKGNVGLLLPADARFDIDADIGRRGNLHTDIAMPTGVKDENRIRGKVNGGGPLLAIETYKGNFEIRKK